MGMVGTFICTKARPVGHPAGKPQFPVPGAGLDAAVSGDRANRSTTLTSASAPAALLAQANKADL